MFKRTSALVVSLLLASPTEAVRLGMMNLVKDVELPDSKVVVDTGV